MLSESDTFETFTFEKKEAFVILISLLLLIYYLFTYIYLLQTFPNKIKYL